MNRKIIITDLTRFREGNPQVCTAGIDPNTGECIRPRPYLTFDSFTRLGMFPGGILSGDFIPDPTATRPHVEDYNFNNLRFLGPCSSADFLSVLNNSASQSIEQGFGVVLRDGQKHIPLATPPSCSIITLRVCPAQLEIVIDNYDKIRIHFTDSSGMSFRFLSITDLGFHDYARRHRESGALDGLNSAIAEQDEVFLRVGLSRNHRTSDREGYWMQVNGIYTFPEKLSYIRSYDSSANSNP